MKNQLINFRNAFGKSLFLGIVISLSMTTVSCEKDEDAAAMPQISAAVNESPITVPFFVQNDNQEMPSNDEDLLYELRLQNPIVDMNGKHMTWAEFSTVKGKAQVTSLEGGFEISLELRGLIPNGVYTIWNVTFNEEGMDASKEMLNIRGIGCIGAPDGSENYFTASHDGKGSITAFTRTPAPLSMIGDILADPIKDEVEFHIVGAYHLDEKTWGPQLGPDGTAVEQFGFIFKK